METLKNNVTDLVNNSQYNDAVNLVAESFNLSFKAEFLRNDFHFVGDKDKRDIYKITLSRGNRKYSFEFGQSIARSGFYASYGRQKYELPREKMNLKNHELKIVKPIAPTLYDVLACLQKYDVGTFEDFCSEFGYETDSRNAKKTYKAVVKEYNKMCSLFNNDELEVLTEIN